MIGEKGADHVRGRALLPAANLPVYVSGRERRDGLDPGQGGAALHDPPALVLLASVRSPPTLLVQTPAYSADMSLFV
jgi:hypothetical protein